MACAAAGTAWLLQFIEDMQQSRAFHKTCELELPEGQAKKIPEVRKWYKTCNTSQCCTRSYNQTACQTTP